MKVVPDGKKKSEFIVGVLFVVLTILFLFISGCTQASTGFTVRPQAFISSPFIAIDENTREVTLPVNESMLVSYPWTPEDGRFWRVSVTQGLFVSGDRYIPYPSDMPVEISGTREWMVKAIAPGKQTFIASLRPRSNSWNQEIIQYQVTVNVPDESSEN